MTLCSLHGRQVRRSDRQPSLAVSDFAPTGSPAPAAIRKGDLLFAAQDTRGAQILDYIRTGKVLSDCGPLLLPTGHVAAAQSGADPPVRCAMAGFAGEREDWGGRGQPVITSLGGERAESRGNPRGPPTLPARAAAYIAHAPRRRLHYLGVNHMCSRAAGSMACHLRFHCCSPLDTYQTNATILKLKAATDGVLFSQCLSTLGPNLNNLHYSSFNHTIHSSVNMSSLNYAVSSLVVLV
jgi:hypothetical protein